MTQIPAYVPEADLPGFWSEDDALATQHFLNTSTGQKLRLRLTNYVLRSAVTATQATSNVERHCGTAHGIALAVKAFENHLPTALAQERKSGSEEDAALSFADEFAA